MKLDTKVGIINIENSNLSQRTLPKQSAEYLQVVFTNAVFANDITTHINEIDFPFAVSPVKSFEVKLYKVLNESDDEKEVCEVVFENNNNNVNFLPGDTVGILPENDEEEVEFMLKVLNLSEKADCPCIIQVKSDTVKKGARIPPYIPVSHTTCRIILTNFLNFKSIPKKSLICSLLEYCEDEQEKFFLETLCCKEGSELYNDFIIRKLLNVLDILRICQSVHPPLSLLIEHLPRLLPRSYSISNYCPNSTNEIKIIFSNPLKNPGITTKYLRKKMNNSSNNIVNLYFRQPSKFRLIDEYYLKDIIMISVGCGVSPFLGFLEYKSYLIEQGLQMGSWYLYSGFKYKSSSIHQDKIIEYKENGILDKYYECLSRGDLSKFKYVQDAIFETQSEFSTIMQSNSSILFVCADGDTISKDIKTTIQKCVFGNMDDDESSKIIKEWIRNGKYVEDIWT